MTDAQALEEVKQCLIHLQGSINILVDGKPILAWQKLTGLKDKLNAFGKKLEKDVLESSNQS